MGSGDVLERVLALRHFPGCQGKDGVDALIRGQAGRVIAVASTNRLTGSFS